MLVLAAHSSKLFARRTPYATRLLPYERTCVPQGSERRGRIDSVNTCLCLSQVRPKSVSRLTWFEHSYVAVSTPVTPSCDLTSIMTSIAKDVVSVDWVNHEMM